MDLQGDLKVCVTQPLDLHRKRSQNIKSHTVVVVNWGIHHSLEPQLELQGRGRERNSVPQQPRDTGPREFWWRRGGGDVCGCI